MKLWQDFFHILYFVQFAYDTNFMKATLFVWYKSIKNKHEEEKYTEGGVYLDI